MSKEESYLDKNEKEVEEKNKKSEQQVAEIWRTMLSGFGGISLSEIAKGFELDDELLGVDDLTKFVEDKLKIYSKKGDN